MEVVRFDSINDVPTSHDLDLRKFVLSASEKFPEGKMKDFSKYIIEKTNPLNLTSKNEILIIVQSDGSSTIKSESETLIKKHDMVIIQPNSSVTIINDQDIKSLVYCLVWSLE